MSEYHTDTDTSSKRRIFDYGHQNECIEITAGCRKRDYQRLIVTPPASTTTLPVPEPTTGTTFQWVPEYTRPFDFQREEEIDILNIPYKRFHQIEEEEKKKKDGTLPDDYAPLDPRIQHGRYRKQSSEQRRKEAFSSVAASARCTAINNQLHSKNLKDRNPKVGEKQAEEQREASKTSNVKAEEKEAAEKSFNIHHTNQNLGESKVTSASVKAPFLREVVGNKPSSVKIVPETVPASQKSAAFKIKFTRPGPASHKLKLLKLQQKYSDKLVKSPTNSASKVLTPPNSIVVEDISEDELGESSGNPRETNDEQSLTTDFKEIAHTHENFSPVSSEGLSEGELPASSPESLELPRQDCGTEINILNKAHKDNRIEPPKGVVTSSDMNVQENLTAVMVSEKNLIVSEDVYIIKAHRGKSNSNLVDYSSDTSHSTTTDSTLVNGEKLLCMVNNIAPNSVGSNDVSSGFDHNIKEHENNHTDFKKGKDIDFEEVDESALASSCILSCSAVATLCNQSEQVDHGHVSDKSVKATSLDDSTSVIVSGSGLDTSKLADRDDLVTIDINSFLSPPSERLLSEDRGEDKTDSINTLKTVEQVSINEDMETIHPSSASPKPRNILEQANFPVLSIPESIVMSPASNSIPTDNQISTLEGETSHIYNGNSIITSAASAQPPLVVVADFDSVQQSVVVIADPSPSECITETTSLNVRLRTDLFEDGHFDDSILNLFSVMASRAQAISKTVCSEASELTRCFQSDLTAYEKIKSFRKFKANFEKCYVHIDRLNIELQAEEVMKYDIVALCGDYEQYKVITVEEMADYYLRLLQLTILIRIAHFVKHKSNLFLLHFRITRILRYYTVAKALYQTEYTFLNIINAIDAKVSSIALIREDLMLIWDKIKAFDHYVDEITVLREHATVGSKGFGMIVDTIVKKVVRNPITPASDPNSAPGSDDIEIVDEVYGDNCLNPNPKDYTYMAVLECISNAFASTETQPIVEQNLQQATRTTGPSGGLAAQEQLPSYQFHQRVGQPQIHSVRNKAGGEHRRDNSASSAAKTRGRRKSVNSRPNSSVSSQSSYEHVAFGSTPIITNVTGGCCGQYVDRCTYSSQSAGISSQGTETLEGNRFEHGFQTQANRHGPPNVAITGSIYDPNQLSASAHHCQTGQSFNHPRVITGSMMRSIQPSWNHGRPYVGSELNTPHSPQMVQMLTQVNRNSTGSVTRQVPNAAYETMWNISAGIPPPAPIVQVNSYNVQNYSNSGVNNVINSYEG